MPDRAVVDERQEAYETVERHLKQVMAYNDIGAESLYGEATYADPDEVMEWEQVLRELEPPERALCAVSEDRQWLVVLEKIVRTLRWCIYRYHEGRRDPWKWHGDRLDTGQGAHEVLATFLEGRNG